jgi:hypothetical protein
MTRRKTIESEPNVASSGKEANMVRTTTFKFSFLEITRSGRNALRMRSVFRNEKEVPTMEMTTTVPSNQFQVLLK